MTRPRPRSRHAGRPATTAATHPAPGDVRGARELDRARLEASLATHRWDELAAEGYSVLPGLLKRPLARDLANIAPSPHDATTTSDVRALDEDMLPPWLRGLRAALYERLTPLVSSLGSSTYPPTWDAFHEENLRVGQRRSLSRIERLRASSFSPARRPAEEPVHFPVQVVALLSEPGVDFVGGELVMVEQRPRMQSRAVVIPLALGDVALITTGRRPARGARGVYTVSREHAVSRVHRGQRLALSLSFHGAS